MKSGNAAASDITYEKTTLDCSGSRRSGIRFAGRCEREYWNRNSGSAIAIARAGDHWSSGARDCSRAAGSTAGGRRAAGLLSTARRDFKAAGDLFTRTL